MLQLWEMLLRLPWSNSINLSRKLHILEDFILLENVKINQIQKCLLTQPTNMLFLLLDKKDLITHMLLILKEPLKKYGNFAEEYCMKENTKQLIMKKRKNSKL